MTLGILVPHWHEAPEDMEPLLDSLAIQQSFDMGELEVIVAYDGDTATELPAHEWSRRYPFHIMHVHAPEGGVSATRNVALDVSKSDYVMFCDADDMFLNACALSIVSGEMQRGFDLLVSNFVEETRDADGRPLYVPHELDQTFVHGKVFRRQWLMDEGIRFDPDLKVHEDSYLNVLAQSLAKDARYCPTQLYLWRWRDASVCRHDPDYMLKTYGAMIDSNDALVREFGRRGMVEQARLRVGVMVLDAYYTMNRPEWLDETHGDYRRAVEGRFAEYLREHWELWESLSAQELVAVSNGIRTRSVMGGMGMETVTIDQWLGHVRSIA